MNATRNIFALAGAALAGTGLVHAAGGHHAVDDATILDPGRCHVESWIEHDRSSHGRAANIGPACHGFGLEWSLGLSHARVDGERDNQVAPQLKWATETPVPGLALGLAAGVDLRARSLRRGGHFVLVPATLELADGDWLLHANAGRAWTRGKGAGAIGGLAIERQWQPRFSSVVEVFRDGPGARAWQVGGRWHLDPDHVSLDVSYARGLRADQRSVITIGVTVEFDRPGRRT